MKTKSMRGKDVDFMRYMATHGDMAAVGNASMNARGDIIDKMGNVMRTRADISAEYHRNNAKAVKHVAIKAMDTVFQTPAEAMKNLQSRAPVAQKVTDERTSHRTRKITDAEE